MRHDRKSQVGNTNIDCPDNDLNSLNRPHLRQTKYHTAHEAAEILCISYRAVLRAVRDGSLRAYRFGKETRISDGQIEDYVLNAIIEDK